MDQRMPVPTRQMLTGAPENGAALRGIDLATEVIADQTEHTTNTDFLGRRGDHRSVAAGSCAGVADGGEAAAQRFERGEFG